MHRRDVCRVHNAVSLRCVSVLTTTSTACCTVFKHWTQTSDSAVEQHGPTDDDQRLPNTLSMAIRGVKAAPLLKRIGTQLAASAGAACHSATCNAPSSNGSLSTGQTVTLSAVLAAMGVSAEAGAGTFRLSVGRHTTHEEVDRGAKLLADAVLEELGRR
jgi:cysteine sulfinate desulfinase/cysteine desulfurase-like protein